MIDRSKIVFTGGSGLLGRAFRKIESDINYPSSIEFNIADYEQMKRYIHQNTFSMIIHAAAFTSPPLVDSDPDRAIETNIIGTSNIVRLCMEINCRLIYISTDYVFKGDEGSYKEDDPVFPVNKYAWSKLGGECAVRMYDQSIIIRTTFGPDRFPYEKAFVDQWTSRESVTVIAKKISKLIDLEITGTIHIGGKRQTVYEFANSLDDRANVGMLSIRDVSYNVPRDTSLDCSKYFSLLS
jgi:dTDP-4-dehydrorhamnose reductase